jgi:TPR repeat protein
MSTPIPPNTKLEGLDLYAPRGARTSSAPDSQASPSQTGPDVPQSDPLQTESERPPAAATESRRVGGTPVDDAIEAIHSYLSASSLQPVPKLRLERDPVNEPPPAFDPPWLGHRAENAPRRRFRLDPEIVPPPPGARPHIVAPTLIVLMVGCAAIIGLTMISAFQPNAHRPIRTSERIPTATPTFDKPGSEPRLVVDVQKAVANEPLSLGVSVDSATGDESLMLAGLALGSRLSAGVPVSEASWRLASRDLNGVYVYAPRGFIGIMNTAVNLLSANQRLIESRAVRLEWIAKSNSSPPMKQIESETVNAPAVRPLNPENSFLMERGRELLERGDIASARLLFQRLANAGIADAALALGATYDPRYLAQHNLIGVAGDETKAQHWYQRANELGSTEAGRVLTQTTAN